MNINDIITDVCPTCNSILKISYYSSKRKYYYCDNGDFFCRSIQDVITGNTLLTTGFKLQDKQFAQISSWRDCQVYSADDIDVNYPREKLLIIPKNDILKIIKDSNDFNILKNKIKTLYKYQAFK